MKILKLSPYYEPEKISSSHLTEDMEKGFTDAGYEIEVICPQPTRGVDSEVRKKYKTIRTETKRDGKITVHRFPMVREKRNPLLRALRYLLVNAVQKRKGCKAKNVDLIIGGSTPPTQGLLCAKVARKLSKKKGEKVPFIYNLQDIFPDSLVNAGMAKKGGLIWRIGRRMENRTYAGADRIVVISEDFKKNVMEKGVPAEKIVVIPNWVNTDNVFPVKREDNVLFDRYGLDRGKYYICYSGTVGHSQNLKLLLDTAQELSTLLPDVRFVIIGEGPAKKETAEEIAARGIANVTMLPFQPYEEIAEVFSLGDAGLIISKPGVGQSSVPSKTFSVMAAARPIIASFDRESELCRLIEKTGCGVTANAGSKEELIAAIGKLYRDRPFASAAGEAGRAYLKEHLDKDKCVGRYLEVMKEELEKTANKGE